MAAVNSAAVNVEAQTCFRHTRPSHEGIDGVDAVETGNRSRSTQEASVPGSVWFRCDWDKMTTVIIVIISSWSESR